MQWQGSYGRKVGKETHHLRISQAFTRVDYRKAVNKENLGTPKLAQRSLHCNARMPSRSASSFKSCTVSCAELPRCFPLVEVSKTKL